MSYDKDAYLDSLRSDDDVRESRIEEVLSATGFYMGPPVGVSMRPMLRNRTDVMYIEPLTGAAHRLDVALYRRGTDYVLHRIVGFYDGGYIMCGDNCVLLERIPTKDVIGVLRKFFRDGHEVDCATSRAYRVYSQVWVAFFPVRKTYKQLRQRVGNVVRRAKGAKRRHSELES